MSYRDQFLAGWVPEHVDLEGRWIVRGLLGPLPVRFFGHVKGFHHLADGVYAGNNRFLGGITTGHYKASAGPSQLDPALRVINIDYNQPQNPWITRGLTDEVRFVSDDMLLGRGIYRPAGWDWEPRNIFWFSVSRA